MSSDRLQERLGAELALLTERERRMLRLLASGHSVKSATAEEAISENAAHELLRSARRKLGTGSSREAARLLAEREAGSQKAGDEKTVIPVTPSHGPFQLRFSKGVIAMSLTALAASAIFVIALQGGRSTSTPPGAEPSPGPGTAPVESPTGAASLPGGAAKVIATVPAQGAVIEPGAFQVAITFDRPMAPGSYSFVRTDEGAYPDCTSQPQLSADARTYTVGCVAGTPGRYVVHFNKPPYLGFRDSATRTPAQEARLEFTVRGESGQQGDPGIAAPKVVLTSPAAGAVIAPGAFTVAITFDRPMAPGSFAFVRSDEGAYPECTGQPQLSADGRTYSLACVASVGARYVMHFNKPPYIGFIDAVTKAPAQEARLEFTVRES